MHLDFKKWLHVFLLSGSLVIQNSIKDTEFYMRFVLSFCLLFLWWPGLSEVVILSVDDWVCTFVLFVVWMRSPAQGATGGWVMPGLVFKWFPLCEFSLFNIPSGSFSGIPWSWSQCSHSKGSGLALPSLVYEDSRISVKKCDEAGTSLNGYCGTLRGNGHHQSTVPAGRNINSSICQMGLEMPRGPEFSVLWSTCHSTAASWWTSHVAIDGCLLRGMSSLAWVVLNALVLRLPAVPCPPVCF